MNLTKAARLLPALFASLQVGVFATPAEAQNDNWVRSCNRSNNLAYCQETDKRRSSGGNTTSSATLGASFAGAMRQSMEAWDTFGKASAGKSLAEFATSDVMAKAQADFLAKQELAKKLSTPEGRRDHYGSLKGTGDARIDYLYAVYADDADGLIWMKKAADAGHANAAYTLAFYHEQGLRGAKQDTKLWFHYAQKAAQAGQDTARALVATIIGVGNAELGVVANPAEGFKVLTEACARQSAYACFQLGEFYQAGLGTKRDLSKAIELFEKVQAHSPASNGVPLSLEIERPKAAFELAKLFASDDGVHQNKARARIKLLESINFPGPRFTDAWLEYAQALIVPTTAYEFPSTDIKRGIEILTWFGERNTAKALDLLGNLYLTGKHGVPKDPAKAISLLEKAASLNYPLAMIRLAGYYVDQNAEGEKVAFGWVEKAANLGDPLGTWRLALHYRDGMGVSKDMGKYQRAIAKACDLKNVAACNELGDSYMKAKDGFPKDIGIAREVLKRADEQDSPRAALLLSLAYLGANAKTEEDVFAGVRYAFIAKERGAEHAEALLEQIAGATRPVMQKAYAQIKEEFK